MTIGTYQRTQNIAESPRACERRLINEVTAELISAAKSGMTGAALMPALHRNREMWNTFSVLCADDDNALPPEVRAGIVSLAGWVSRYTSNVVAGKDCIDPLVEVNQLLSEGLQNTTALAA